MGDGVQSNLQSYYEEEARRGLRRPPRGRRRETRDDFLRLLKAEGRNSVLDLGAGPGGDGEGFVAAGHRYVGLDLAHGNAVLAAAEGISVVQGSIGATPFPHHSFDAGWSMSTLMHIPDDEVERVAAQMVAPLRAGAPFWIGQWGGTLGEHIDTKQLEGEQRLFSLRSMTHNHAILDAVATVEHNEIWPTGPEGWEYHLFHLRA